MPQIFKGPWTGIIVGMKKAESKFKAYFIVIGMMFLLLA